MQQFTQNVASIICQIGVASPSLKGIVIRQENKEVFMLRLSVTKNEYLMVGENVKITFIGGNDRTLKLMIDAPKEVNVARGKAIEKRAAKKEAYTENDCFC